MHCSSDLAISHGDAKIVFRYLEWDSAFFGRPSYALAEVDKGEEIPDLGDQLRDKLAGTFTTAKVSTSCSVRLLTLLQDAGFVNLDTEVTLEAGKGVVTDNPVSGEDIQIERIKENHGLPYEVLGRAFSMTRFHADQNISQNKADDLWIAYLKNYQIGPKCHLYAARVDREVAGVILVSENQKEARLDLVAVVPAFQGQGVGKLLAERVLYDFRSKPVLTGTQVKNIGALNFYIKFGFSKVRNTSFVLHKWG